jgi:Holliday junction DNA helicase RuvB
LRTEKLEAVVRGLARDPEVLEALKRIVEYEEESAEKYGKPLHWEWIEVGVDWPVVKKLALAGVLEVVGGRRKCYLLKDRELVKRVVEEVEAEEALVIEGEAEAGGAEEVEIPPDFWEPIEGYDDIKEVFLASIRADRPVHILLHGPPSSGKSLMLMEVERLKGSVFITAGTTTKIGIRDVLLERRPRFLIIDEIDKVTNPNDLSVLLTLMESGRVVVATHNRREEVKMKTWVFAGCNRLKRLSPELLDRFLKFHLRPYDEETLRRVIVKSLVKREGVEEGLAKHIAEVVVRKGWTVRDAVKIARLSKTKEDVDRIARVIEKYSLP